VAAAGDGVCQYIRFTGEGEPLIAPHIFEMLTYAVEKSGTTVTITTNGSLNHRNKLESLMATGVDLIDVSIDAFSPETYARIRVKGDLNVTRENVRRMIDLSKAADCHTKVIVSYIEQKENVHETADFERYWKDQGADYVVIRRMHSHAGVIVQIAQTMRDANSQQQRRPCLYPWERIVINPRGFLSFCPDDWVHGSTIADYRTTTIAETWQGEFYTRLRQAHLANCFVDHQFCGQCPDWASTRWPSEGRSYADLVEDFKGSE
jgi:MoaA/NifB/PqqE/SkfB family radical SAM enzyme